MEKKHTATAFDKKAVIENAKKATMKDGYDRYVIGCTDGVFSFCRAGYDKPVTPRMPGEILFGKVEAYRVNGILNARYHDYSRGSLWSFFSTLEAGRTYAGKDLLHLFNSWASENHIQAWTLPQLYNALTSETSIVSGFMQDSIVGGKRRFAISSEMQSLISSSLPPHIKATKPIVPDSYKEEKPAMKPFRIKITETYVKEIEVYAEDSLKAEEIAEDLCNEGTVDLDADNFTTRSTECLGISRPSDLKLHEVYNQYNGTYTIYQLKNTDDLHYHRFAGLRTLQMEGNRVEAKNYDKVYSGPLPISESKESILNDLYAKFNTDHPSDFAGRSLSVSDIIVLEIDGKSTAYYADTFGFKEVPEFFESSREKAKPSLDGQIKAADEKKTASISGSDPARDMDR